MKRARGIKHGVERLGEMAEDDSRPATQEGAMQVEVSWFLALGAGVLTFFTPCVLPILPAYLSFITGRAVEDILANRPARREILPPIILFCLGFSIIFVIMGATATTLGQVVYEYQRTVEVVGGILVIVFGLQQLGVLKWRFLQLEKRTHLRRRPTHALGALFIGVAFAIGWTPCLGPLLGSILAVAGTRETLAQGVFLLTLFSAGLSAPFIALGLALGTILPRFRAANRFMRWIVLASGTLLVVMGLLLLTDQMRILTRLIT
jgi:cytochrome c-type biogenesis protein